MALMWTSATRLAGLGLLLTLWCGCSGDPPPQYIYVYPDGYGPPRDVGSGDSSSKDLPVTWPDVPPIPDVPQPDIPTPPDPGGPDTGNVTCEAGKLVCVSLTQNALCNAQGNGYESVADCPWGKVCDEGTGSCKPLVCSPGQKSCADVDSWHTCLPTGTGFTEPVDCDPGYACITGGLCVDMSCFGQVMLLVDGSGSMVAHWETVAASIDALLDTNPTAAVGVWVFPQAGTSCQTKTTPEVPLTPSPKDQIASWFDSHAPYGKTPLVDAMETVLSAAPGVFAGDPGALVVLSDGADTCAYDWIINPPERTALIVADLEQTTQALFDQHQVKTFVIGYNYDGDPAQLEAIATHGGTDKTTYTAAGNEDELTNALVTVITDLKLCL